MKKKMKLLIVMAILIFTLIPLCLVGAYGFARFNEIQKDDGERTINVKREDIVRDISTNIETIRKDLLDITSLFVYGDVDPSINLELIEDHDILDYIVYENNRITSFKNIQYDRSHIEDNIQAQFFTEDGVVGFYEDKGQKKICIYSKIDKLVKDENVYSLLIFKDSFFYRFITNSEPYEIYLIDGEFRVMTSNMIGEIGNSIIDSLSKSMIDGEQNVEILGEERISYDFIDLGEVDIYLRVEENISREISNLKSYIVMMILISVLIEAAAFLFAWKLIKLIDIEFVRVYLKSSNKNVKELLNKLDETVIWIDDVVNHYDELNLLKDDIIEIRNSLPKDSDDYEENEVEK